MDEIKVIVRCKSCSHSSLLRSPKTLEKVTASTKFRCGNCQKTDVEIYLAQVWGPESQFPRVPGGSVPPSTELLEKQSLEKQLQANVVYLKTERQNLIAAIHQLKIEKKQREIAVQNLEEKGQQFKEGVLALSVQLTQLNGQKKQLNDEIVTLKSKTVQTEARHKEVTAEVNELNQEVTDLFNEKTQLDLEIKESEREKHKLEMEIDILSQRIEDLQQTQSNKSTGNNKPAPPPTTESELDRLLGGR